MTAARDDHDGEARPRRTAAAFRPPATVLTVDSLVLDPGAGRVSRAGRVLKLLPRQYALLAYLMNHANSICSRQAIAWDVWGDETAMWTNVITVNINGLRKEVEREGLPVLLHTIRGRGYLLGELPG